MSDFDILTAVTLILLGFALSILLFMLGYWAGERGVLDKKEGSRKRKDVQ